MRFFFTTRFVQHMRSHSRAVKCIPFALQEEFAAGRLPTRVAKYAFQTSRVRSPLSNVAGSRPMKRASPFREGEHKPASIFNFPQDVGAEKIIVAVVGLYRQCGESNSRQCSIIHEVKQVPLRPPVERLASKWKRIYALGCATRYISH